MLTFKYFLQLIVYWEIIQLSKQDFAVIDQKNLEKIDIKFNKHLSYLRAVWISITGTLKVN